MVPASWRTSSVPAATRSTFGDGDRDDALVRFGRELETVALERTHGQQPLAVVRASRQRQNWQPSAVRISFDRPLRTEPFQEHAGRVPGETLESDSPTTDRPSTRLVMGSETKGKTHRLIAETAASRGSTSGSQPPRGLLAREHLDEHRRKPAANCSMNCVRKRPPSASTSCTISCGTQGLAASVRMYRWISASIPISESAPRLRMCSSAARNGPAARFEHRAVQTELVTEVVVDHRRGRARLRCDLADRDSGKTAREKQPPRSLEQRFAHGRVIARARPAARGVARLLRARARDRRVAGGVMA